MIRRRALFCFTLVSLFAISSRAQQSSLVIINAQIADGTGAPLRKANLRIAGSRITKIDNFKPSKTDQVLDATGLVLSDRKSTRLNSSHLVISYAVFCLKKKTK